MVAVPDEYEEMHLGIGEHLIPLGALRSRLAELPTDKNAEIICFCKISLRGYEAETILRAYGYTNVSSSWRAVSWPGRIRAKNKGLQSKRLKRSEEQTHFIVHRKID